MIVALLSAANCIHTARWADGLSKYGIEVHLISMHELTYSLNDNVFYHQLPFSSPHGYMLNVFSLKKLLENIKPDILNAHYASGYGLLANFSSFKPYLLSVWGSDVYDFPEEAFWKKYLLKKNLIAATSIASTSHAMAVKTSETYNHKHIFITSFGIDEKKFVPDVKRVRDNKFITIGTIKTLESKYGIDLLIRAFAQVVQHFQGSISLKLEITGKGSQKDLLINLARELGVYEDIIFHGFVEHNDIVSKLQKLDIYVALSRLESFGVAILEASSCAIPVVVSDADGPAEVVIQNETGIIVEKENVLKAANAIIWLIENPTDRERMGTNGREQVLKNYSWSSSVETMVNTLKDTIKVHKDVKS